MYALRKNKYKQAHPPGAPDLLLIFNIGFSKKLKFKLHKSNGKGEMVKCFCACVDEPLGLIPGFQHRVFFYNADLNFLCSQVVLCIIGGISHQFFAESQVSVRR